MLHQLASVALVLVALVMPPQAMSQESEPTSTESATASSVVDTDVAQEIFNRLDAAVEASVEGVKVGAEFTWPILVRQQLIEGVIYTIPGVFGWFLLAIALPAWIKQQGYAAEVTGSSYAGYDGPKKEEQQWFIMAVSFTGVGTVFAMIGAITFFDGQALTKLLNPEYHAFMDVLNALGF